MRKMENSVHGWVTGFLTGVAMTILIQTLHKYISAEFGESIAKAFDFVVKSLPLF